jgi:xanthosine utilization system XapX-like protein
MAIEHLQQVPEPALTVAPAHADDRDAPGGAPEPHTATPVVVALELGWRFAALYADLERPLHHAVDAEASHLCLPALETLPHGDQLELQVEAAASLARRLDAPAHAAQILALGSEVREACDPQAVRARLRACHNRLIKDLWAKQGIQGKAYELGNSLFDSWNRVRLAEADPQQTSADAWRKVFGPERTERIKVLLDDLQTQLPGTAVTVVKAHLDFWRDAVAMHLETAAVPPIDGAELVQAQTVIWRQLLTKDKEPEAFLQREDRRRVHREFKQLVWRSLLRPTPLFAGLAGIALLVGLLAGVIQIASTAQSLIALLGAIGLSQASLAVVARKRMEEWIELLWNRALANVVFDATCKADEAFAWRESSLSCSLDGARRRLTRKAAPALPKRPDPQL